MRNVEYLDSVGMTGPDVVLAHCIHLDGAEMDILARSKTAIAHCPGSNFKLGSGIAPIPELIARDAIVTLGADGAPCNNRMDMFAEMRLAALMQKPRLGPKALPAEVVLDMATLEGARVLGTGGGDIQPGNTADIIALEPDCAHSWGGGHPAGAVVYASTPSNIRHVWVEGDPVVVDGSIPCWNWEETVEGCRGALRRLEERARR